MALFRWLVVACCCLAFSQSRMSDKDVEGLMKNLKEDSKKFKSSFDSAIDKSTVRKTSKEKDAKALVSRFVKETDGMLHHFSDKKKGDSELQTVLRSSDQIEAFMSEVPLGSKAGADWQKVKSELNSLSDAFGLGRPSK